MHTHNRLLLDLVLHRVHGAHSTRGWMERLAVARYGAPTAPEPLSQLNEITIDDVMKPTKWCEAADAPTRNNPAPCSLAVGEPRVVTAAALCRNHFREGEAPLPAKNSELLIRLNEDADWVMASLANIGGGSGRRKDPPLLVEGRELILGDWVEEMAASVVGVHRAAAFIRHCFVEQPYYHTEEDPGGDDSGEWELWDEYFRFDLELDYDAPPNMIDGRPVEKGWRRREAEALEAEVREEHPEMTDEEVVIECERRS